MGAKTSLLLLAVLCLALGIARGDFGLPVATGADHVIEINFWNGFTGPDGRVMLELVRSFNEQNASTSHVSMQRIAWATYYNKLMVSALNARGPEVFVLQAQMLARMDRAGIVDSVDELFKDPLLVADFDEPVLRRVNFGTKETPRRIGLPLDIWPQGLYCNADMLKAIGFTNPDGTARAPRTRDEFLQAAAAMKHGEQWGFGFGAWNNNFMTLVPQFGGRYVDENGEPTLDDPGNIDALQFLVDLLQEYHVAPPPEGGVAGWVGFRQQRVGMVFDGIYMLGDLKRLEGHPYFGAPMPQLGPKPGTLADSHILCVRKGLDERRRQATERFIRYISDNSLAWADAGQIPARRSVRESDAFKKLQVQSAFSQQLPYVMYPPNTPSLSELQLRINLAVEKAIRGRASAADALHEAQADYQRYLERDRIERQFAADAEGAR